MNKKFFFLFLLFLFFTFFSAIIYSENRSFPPKYKKWIDEEVSYIITPKEKNAFYKLESDRERELFIEEFWKERDPTPGTPKNEFKEEHYRRIEYANKTFVRNAAMPGWKTDRGRIYIMLGEPAQIARFNSMEIYPIEIWYYQGTPKFGQPPHFRLLFFQRGGVGEYKLYNPLSDGPRSLTPMTAAGGFDFQDDEAFKFIKTKVSQELAEASWSCFPYGTNDSSQKLAIPSSILLGQIYSFPHKKVRDDYVYDFLEHKATVDVSYSVNHIGNQHIVSVLQNESGLCFVNYGLEPEVLSVDFYEDEYTTNLKLTLRVIDPGGKTVFQQELNFPFALTKEQFKKIGKRPFHLYDSFPLIPGRYTFQLLLENAVSKEFTSVEKEISVPEPQSLWMSPLILARRVDKDSPYHQVSKAFQVGNLQIYPSFSNRFSQKDVLFLFFQITGLGEDLKEEGTLEFNFYSENERFHYLSQKIKDYKSDRNFLAEFLLDKFPEGRYQIKVTLKDKEGKEIVSERKEFVLKSEPFPEPWVLTQTSPPEGDPLYCYLLGNQFLLKGEVTKARNELEKAYLSSPDSLDYALGYAKVLLILGEYKKIGAILLPFAEAKREDYHLFFYLGKSCQEEGKLEKAIHYYQKALAHRGNVIEILNSIGFCYYFLGDDEEALRAWQKSLEVNPDQEKIKKIIEMIKEK